MSDTPSISEDDFARVVLERLGIDSPLDLGVRRPRGPIPTFGAYVPVVESAVSTATRKTYSPYWATILQHWAELPLTQPSPSEIKHLAGRVRANAVIRRNSREGRGAAELFIAALRCIYKHAIDDELISEHQNPASRVRKPQRLPSGRFALSAEKLRQINDVGARTGNDPLLDALLLRFHEETAGRRGGALALRSGHDIDPEQCLVRLREKGGTARWQPVSQTLMTALLDHAEDRGAQPGEPLLRYRNGNTLTRRRYDYLWDRIGRHLPWVASLQVTTHWLRHTTLTWVERNFGYAVARAYAGHFDRSGEVGTTATYVKAGLHEVVTALAALTGEPHPLAQQEVTQAHRPHQVNIDR
ncbi:MAG: site-specific integrase [Actinophytocola sp.]|uniref:tyrosine-type recombinase/integrase n=1 Tax=Actinophytocola sp. TaxID=1872138 RepID=UPI003C75C8D1